MFNLFRRVQQLTREIDKAVAERDRMIDQHAREKQALHEQLHSAREKLAEIERKAKHADEDMAHLVKIKESKIEMDSEKRQLERERQKEAEIAAVKDTYRDKLEAQLQKQLDDMRGMYAEILARLPNVNVRLKGDVGG